MSYIAVICEYNPFHNGHKYQIETAKNALSADGVIAIMSGNFVQRGEPAICNKWERAKMALSCGADLVIELPVVFATQSAEHFAFGGVKLADSLGIVSHLVFGSECDNLEILKRCADFVESPEVKDKTAEFLKNGISYPAARSQAAGKEFSNILEEPNNILAVEYIKALNKIGSNIAPLCIRREGVIHDSCEANGNFASASFIRNAVKNGKSYKSFLPEESMQILKKVETFADKSSFDSIITYLLRSISPKQLKNIADMAEGLEHRFIEAARNFKTVNEISDFVKTKRYTKTRIDRILINILLGITQEDIESEPEYIRVLGFNSKGEKMLSLMKLSASLPIITKVKDDGLSKSGINMLKKDIYATDVYSLISGSVKSGLDFYQKIVKED